MKFAVLFNLDIYFARRFAAAAQTMPGLFGEDVGGLAIQPCPPRKMICVKNARLSAIWAV